MVKPIVYKGKTIINVDFSDCGTMKEKTKELLNNVYPVVSKYPEKSVLILTNANNFFFSGEILKLFQEVQEKITPFEKKAAVINMRGLQKIAYKAIVGLTHSDYTKVFDSEEEAKEWLIS